MESRLNILLEALFNSSETQVPSYTSLCRKKPDTEAKKGIVFPGFLGEICRAETDAKGGPSDL